jgi:excisionase family DNA binding protein
MKAYATAEPLVSSEQPGNFHLTSSTSRRQAPTGAAMNEPVIDLLLDRLADLIAERLAVRLSENEEHAADEWIDARGAADYLGVHRDTIRKLAAERAIPVHQDGPRCKLFFCRAELDDWRRTSRVARSRLRAVS